MSAGTSGVGRTVTVNGWAESGQEETIEGNSINASFGLTGHSRLPYHRLTSVSASYSVEFELSTLWGHSRFSEGAT